MRRKLLIVSMLFFAMMGLTSCGSKSADSDESVQTVETVQSVDEEESSSDEVEHQSETAADEASTEFTTEEAEESGQDGSEVMWYMDAEGLKNDELGIIIRRNNDKNQVLGMSVSDGYDNGLQFYCDYYDGDIDTYITECPIIPELERLNGNMQKASIGDIEYAYALNDTNFAFVAFVGNGIVVSKEIYLSDGKTPEDYVRQVMSSGPSKGFCIGLCEKFNMDCMAYMTDDGIYCPALGMKFTIDGISSFTVRCGQEKAYSSMDVVRITNEVSDSGAYVEDAQYAVEKYVEREVNNWGEDRVSVGEMETIDFGKYTYYGKGYTITTEVGGGGKYFRSDDTKWSIDFSYDDGSENYIDCIESME